MQETASKQIDVAFQDTDLDRSEDSLNRGQFDSGQATLYFA